MLFLQSSLLRLCFRASRAVLRKGRWVVLLPLCLCAGAQAQIDRDLVQAVNSSNGKPLSQRVANYTIDARLDTTAKTLEATETLEYRNLSDQALTMIPFHLYLNAFRPQSSLSIESHLTGPGIRYREAEQGSIDVTSISAEGFGDLSQGTKFTAPDDGNLNDHTVMEVALPKPLEPGGSIRLQLAFRDKFPLSVRRNGFSRDFIMGAQWFPKPGVFWHGAWNCHQYHLDTEFFADFGTYNVTLKVPQQYTVGGSGIVTAYREDADGTKTVSFRGEDIHDFAWAASPHFQVDEDLYVNSLGTVKLQALVLDSHPGQAQRYLSALKRTMRKYDEWFGPYPYKQITLVDPDPDTDAGGMEYPTLITGDMKWWEPAWMHYGSDTTVVHEFGHQYWYGMVATNEFEEPWLDEGIDEYVQSKVMGSLYGKDTSVANGRNIYGGGAGLERLNYLESPSADPIVRQGWQFLNDHSYGSIAYSKTAVTLTTLEAMLGEDVLRRALRVYFTRYRFQHPTGSDFVHTLEEASGRNDIEPYLSQAIYGTEILDYAVDPIVSGPITWGDPGTTGFRSSVVVRRKGTFLMPVHLEVGFADGSTEQATWDGKNPWARFSWDKPTRATFARIDADRNILLDTNLFNNSYTTASHTTARWKLTNYWIVAQQLMAQWLSFLV